MPTIGKIKSNGYDVLQIMKKIRLVAIDLDGTLLNSAKQITKTTSAIIEAVRKRVGAHIVLATARPPRSVMPYYSLLKLDTPMINYNGALVFDPTNEKIILHKPLPYELAKGIIYLARKKYPDVLVSAEILDCWFTDRIDKRFLTETARQYKPDVIAPIKNWLKGDVTKLMFLGDESIMLRLAHAILIKFPCRVSIVQTEGFLLQIMRISASKAKALKTIAERLEIPRQQVMAIGDNANDVGMLKWAGVGVAMDNAAVEAKKAADFITDHHDADGAAKAIEKLILKGLSRK